MIPLVDQRPKKLCHHYIDAFTTRAFVGPPGHKEQSIVISDSNKHLASLEIQYIRELDLTFYNHACHNTHWQFEACACCLFFARFCTMSASRPSAVLLRLRAGTSGSRARQTMKRPSAVGYMPTFS